MMIRLLLFLSFLSVLGACKENLEPAEIIYKVPPEFTVDLFEARDRLTGDSIFGLWIESMAQFEFSNFGIRTKVQLDGQHHIFIEIMGQDTPVVGKGAPGKAKSFVPIGHLDPGTYDITVALGSAIQNKGSLEVRTNEFILNLPNPQGLVVQNSIVYPLRENLIWGYVENPNEFTKTAAEAFILEMKALSADHGLIPGFYSYFTITGAGGNFLHTSIDPGVPSISFIRKIGSDTQALRNVLQTYRNLNNQTPLKIHCFSTLGEL
jgi:hypothetical protein